MSSRYFHTLAIDFDGTLADDGAVGKEVLEALREIRTAGERVILVTGRILGELTTTWSDATSHVDAIVAENGAVLWGHGRHRTIVQPVDRRLEAALVARGVAHRVGEVLLACSAHDETTVLAEVRRLGIDCQLVRNRDELMVLPAGVTKATGLIEALRELGLSRHNTVGIGDAENDASLLAACELSVAVANAVPALKAQADIVLDAPDGEGVARFLRGPIMSGTELHRSDRFQLRLGVDDAGVEIRLSSSPRNLLIAGESGDGKSYLGGLIAEQLIEQGYSLLVLDPEGDFVGLDELPGTVLVGVERGLLDPALVTKLLVRGSSVVLDLSGIDGATRSQYLAELLPEIEASRQRCGIPQWVIVDEAHEALERDLSRRPLLTPDGTGRCLITWQPHDLRPETQFGIDGILLMGGATPPGSGVALAAALANVDAEQILQQLSGAKGRVLLVERAKEPAVFTGGQRSTAHFRREHKYGLFGVDEARRFHLHVSEQVNGSTARNLSELEAEIVTSPASLLLHHCPRHDFSRWISDVFRDDALADAVRLAEDELMAHSSPAAVEAVRQRLVAALGSWRAPRGPNGIGPSSDRTVDFPLNTDRFATNGQLEGHDPAELMRESPRDEFGLSFKTAPLSVE